MTCIITSLNSAWSWDPASFTILGGHICIWRPYENYNMALSQEQYNILKQDTKQNTAIQTFLKYIKKESEEWHAIGMAMSSNPEEPK